MSDKPRNEIMEMLKARHANAKFKTANALEAYNVAQAVEREALMAMYDAERYADNQEKNEKAKT